MHENHGWSNILIDGGDQRSDHIEREPGLICKECKYKAEDIYDYDGHVWSEICTDPTVQKEREADHSLSCEFCEEKFGKLRNLMRHKKSQHEESINLCWNYASGNCKFGEDDCWFSHSNGDETRRGDSSFECNNCDETFSVKARFLHHMKKHHVESVPTCRNMTEGACRYGRVKCWFNHGDQINSTKDENNEQNNEEVIEKIFNMMEKFTQQIVKIKEMNNLK